MSLDAKVQELNAQLDEHRQRRAQLEDFNKAAQDEKSQVEKEMLRLHRRLTELSKEIRENDKKIADYNTILEDSEKAYEQLIAHSESILYALTKTTEELKAIEQTQP